jgi:2,5-diamino-6-(ribosylamino)-4(3H)-pyrimidinone 5'-phosphate reductase
MKKVIMHNSVSLDGSFINFEFPPELMGLHYQIAAGFGKVVSLFGSNTANVAIQMFGGLSKEAKEDFKKPEKENLPFWFAVDSKATLKNKLHFFRRLEYCRDIVVLVSKNTDKDYLNYLSERNYDYYILGEERVDLVKAVKLISEKYDMDAIMVDSGRGLTNAMLNQGLIDEISLLVVPTIVGEKSENMFKDVKNQIKLKKTKEEEFQGGYVWLLYEVQKS